MLGRSPRGQVSLTQQDAGNPKSAYAQLVCAVTKGLALLEQQTPKTYKEAITCSDAPKWIASMGREIKSCVDRNTWTEVEISSLPRGTNIIDCKWVFKIKWDENGRIIDFKSRLTPKGFMQKHGVDYFEVYACTGQYKTMRLGLSLAASMDDELEQMDVPSAFLQAKVDEDIYMKMPPGFEKPGMAVKLNMSLYGIKQGPRNWWLLFSGFLVDELKFKQCVSDPGFFIRRSATGRLIRIYSWVDDVQVAFAGVDRAEWNGYKQKLVARFGIKDMGPSKWILGMRITRDRSARTIHLDHELYISKALEKFGMDDCKPVFTPEAIRGSHLNADPDDSSDGGDEPCDKQRYMEMVGTLMYASISTRPDITTAVRCLARHMQDPRRRDEVAAKRVMRYLSGTKDMGLLFGRKNMQPKDVHAVAGVW